MPSQMARLKACTGQKPWLLADSYNFIATFLHTTQAFGPSLSPREVSSENRHLRRTSLSRTTRKTSIRSRGLYPPVHFLYNPSHTTNRRHFHDYFVTNLPSSSLHPDSRSSTGPHHKLPRSASTPHIPGRSPAAALPQVGVSRELTVVRIPLRSAKHHFGVSVSRGTRAYNEDAYQAGTIEIPAFAKRAPISLSRGPSKTIVGGGATSADGASGDPQVFYFGVFDGHGGSECSEFLRSMLHEYVEEAAGTFELGSSLKKKGNEKGGYFGGPRGEEGLGNELLPKDKDYLGKIEMKGKEEIRDLWNPLKKDKDGVVERPANSPPIEGEEPVPAGVNKPKAIELEKTLMTQWKDLVGGYYRRFKPEYFSVSKDGSISDQPTSIETVLMYSFLKADLDFVTAQSRKPDPNSPDDKPVNADEIFGSPSRRKAAEIGGSSRFLGGSTASVALISTPTPTPFWHPASPSTLVAAHVGDTRIILCDTATGLARPITTNHHPSSPIESTRLRRYAATFVTDSFGEERMSGLANTRAFGDMRSKRIGVSAEPEITRVEMGPAEYSFLVLCSDGVSGHNVLSDQEICDVVKEAKTPEQGARDVVSYATEVGREGDNATCLVIRLGGWERRGEGGLGSMGTKEMRDYRTGEAGDPRLGRT